MFISLSLHCKNRGILWALTLVAMVLSLFKCTNDLESLALVKLCNTWWLKLLRQGSICQGPFFIPSQFLSILLVNTTKEQNLFKCQALFSRFILRLLPVELTCYASELEISKAIQPLVAEYFPSEAPTPQKVWSYLSIWDIMHDIFYKYLLRTWKKYRGINDKEIYHFVLRK